MNERRPDRSRHARQRRWWLALGVAAAFLCRTHATQDAIANGDTRTLTLYHTHSKESASITFRRNGQYDSDGLKQLNWFLRDWRNDDQTKMDPRLFDVVWAAYRESGSGEPINIVSAYRSPGTNAMLRRRSRAVAENSQHIAGKAMDFFLSDVGMDKVRAIGMRLQQGGVGFYPTSYNPFVHLDVGSVRSWPRMTHDQLARVFPDGKTVHLPTDGKPLARYEEARAEILSRGGAVAGVSSYADAEGAGGRRRSLWAGLFGGDDEDAAEARAPARGPVRVAARSSPGPVGGGSSDDAGTRGVAVALPQIAAPRREPAFPPPVLTPSLTATLFGEPRPAPAPEPNSAEPAKSAALAFAPVPPTRPSEIAALFSSAPLPPLRPGVPATDPRLASVAEPPLEAAASPDGAPFRLAGIPHALPPTRPGPVSPTASPVALPPSPDLSDERLALKAMFSASISEPTPRRTARLVTARTAARALDDAARLNISRAPLRMAFSQNTAGLDPRAFTGPAVAPLPILR